MSNLLDRSTQPEVFDIAAPEVLEFEHSKLANGIDLFVMQGGTQAITKIDIVTKSGVQYADKAFVAGATNALVGEGTRSFTSAQIAQKLDFYGAFLSQKGSNFRSTISIVMPSKHLREVLPIFEEIMKAAVFPQSEFDIYVEKTAQELAINNQTPGHVARANMKKLVYADGSRYARKGDEKFLRESVSVNDLRRFYAKTYTPEDTMIFVSGQPSAADIDLIARTFSDEWRAVANIGLPAMPVYHPTPRNNYEVMPGAQQATICMGRKMPAFGHEDNYAFSVLDTILGGYFGSRLMSNIREEKGLTYGIGSSLAVSQYNGLHVIISDVRPDKYQLVLDEIAKEMTKLRTEAVSDEELGVVKNYMKGDLLRQFDSVLASADTLLKVVAKGGTSQYVRRIFETVDSITPEQLMSIARKYLHFEDYCISIAGPKID